MRAGERKPDELRPVKFHTDYTPYAEGSVLVSAGNTRVLCSVSIEDGVPPWMSAQHASGGWVTAEYSMLPRATHTRSSREIRHPRGRTQEIQRLVGRSLRASVDLALLGPRTCLIDCDVLVADGGTRTASVTGGYVALALALRRMIHDGALPESVLLSPVAAISAGIIDGNPHLDLCYEEDVAASVDANFVLNGEGNLIEVQGTAEGKPFSSTEFLQLLELASKGVRELLERQEQALSRCLSRSTPSIAV